jgi:hypothetical protein
VAGRYRQGVELTITYGRADGRKDETPLQDEQSMSEAPHRPGKHDALATEAPPAIAEREGSPSSANCTVVRFVPLPKEERVGRLARALAVLLGGEEARDEQAAGH